MPADEVYLRPGKWLQEFSRQHPDAWKHVADGRAIRDELGGWHDWCHLPLKVLGTIAARFSSGEGDMWGAASKAGQLGALAAWRMGKGIYRFDPDVLDVVWDAPVKGEIPSEVLRNLPEWCPYVATPGKQWKSSTLNGFFAFLMYHDDGDRTFLNFALDLTDSNKEHLVTQELFLGHGGISESIDFAAREYDRMAELRHVPPTPYSEEGCAEYAASITPLVSLLLYLCTQAAEVRDAAGTNRLPARPVPKKTKKGPREFPPDAPTRWDVGYRMGPALRTAYAAYETEGQTEGVGARKRPHLRRQHWHKYWVGPRDAVPRQYVVKLQPLTYVNVKDVEDLVPTVRSVD